MKAKFVYEAMGDILKPKSEEEIWTSIGDLSPDDLFYKSLDSGFLPGIKKGLEGGANVFVSKVIGYASAEGHYDIVKFLLDNGADVHARDDYALRLASQSGHYDVVALLLDNGADVHAKSDSALLWASNNGHDDVVELIKKWMEKDEG